MEKANERVEPWMDYLQWGMGSAVGIMFLLPRGLGPEIPFGVLVLSANVSGALATLLKGRPTALRVSRVALAAVALGCSVAELAGAHWVKGLALLAAWVLLVWAVWRKEFRRRRSVAQLAS